MPPTDMMKTLSRADLTKKFEELLLNLHIGRHDQDSVHLYNILPYSSMVIYEDTLCRCLGINVCESVDSKISKTSVEKIDFGDIAIVFEKLSNIAYDSLNSVFYLVPSSNNSFMDVVAKRSIAKIVLVKEFYRVAEASLYNTGILIENAVALSIYLDNGRYISIASSHSFGTQCANSRLCRMEFTYPVPQILLGEKPIVDILRRLQIATNIVEIGVAPRIRKSLVEFIDSVTVVKHVEIFENGVEMNIVNLLSKPLNAVVRFGVMPSKIVVDDLSEYSVKHSVVRLALDPYGSAKLRVHFSQLLV